MAQTTMYPAKVNSPELSLKTAITTTGQTSIVIAGAVSTKFPAYPNLLVIGTGEDAETIRFTEAPTGNDTDGWTYANVERGFQGSPNTWAAGTPVSRLFTAYDHDTFKANIEDLASTRALINSQAFTGTPSLPTGTTGVTQAISDDSTKLSTTAFTHDVVDNAISEVGGIGKPIYSAIVYQDGTYTYAVDKNGNILNRTFREIVDTVTDTTHIVCRHLHGFTIANGLTITNLSRSGSSTTNGWNDTTHTLTLSTSGGNWVAGDVFEISWGTTATQLMSAGRDDIPIQAAIEYAQISTVVGTSPISAGGGMIWITPGKYKISSGNNPINVKQWVSVVVAQGNAGSNFSLNYNNGGEIIYMRPYTSWEGGEFYFYTDSGTPTIKVFTIDGLDNHSFGQNKQYIRDVIFRNNSASGQAGGTCLYMKTIDNTVSGGGIFGWYFSNLNMYGKWGNGIHLYASNTVPENRTKNNLVSNTFENLQLTYLVNFITLEKPNGWNSGVIELNKFQNIIMESGSSSSTGIRIDEGDNVFDTVWAGDWEADLGYFLQFGSNCNGAKVYNITMSYPSTTGGILDDGSDNTVTFVEKTLNYIALRASEALSSTNIPTLTKYETANGLFPLWYLPFSQAGRGTQRACWLLPIDSRWTTSGWTSTVEWTCASNVTTKTEWLLYAHRVNDAESYNIDGAALPLVATIPSSGGDAYGGGAGYYKRLTASSGNFKITGNGNTVLLELKRSSGANDTMTQDAWFMVLRLSCSEG